MLSPCSTLGGPIPPDPIPLLSSARSRSSLHGYQQYGRPRSAGGQSSVRDLISHLQEQTSAQPPSHRPKPAPKNFLADNVKRLKEYQSAAREKAQREGRQGQLQPVKALWRSHKYDNVPSKVAPLCKDAKKVSSTVQPQTIPSKRSCDENDNIKEKHPDDCYCCRETKLSIKGQSLSQIEKQTKKSGKDDVADKEPSLRLNLDEETQTTQQTRDSLKAWQDSKRTGNRQNNGNSETHFHQQNPTRSSSRISMNSKTQTDRGKSTNFVKMNAAAAKQFTLRKSPSESNLASFNEKKEERFRKQYKPGHIPKYLQQRQEQWKNAEVERLANMPDADCPPGHTMLSKEERLNTLKLLHESEEIALRQLNSLPLFNDSLRYRRQREELHKKLTEIEDGIRIFSKTKVFIREDSSTDLGNRR